MAQGRQPTRVQIWLFRDKDKFVKKTEGKIYGGMVDFKEADPTEPVIWLGQKEYCITDLATKRSILFYDTISKMLFRPSEMTGSAGTDMVTQATRNVLLGARDAGQTLGVQDTTNMAFKYGLAVILLMTILALVFVYLIVTSAHPSGSEGAVTTIVQGLITIPTGGG